ncbi:ester cyclase [Quadrisphaera sp. INWT6]|uniref:ester cyclase n=1 Tax=Quadrisphaera sp. INWT6 TaxID=2596917 RepID=UPI0018923526|nr:ester cyclase [Quadrisphaera sp. INWT6]MBF5080784.1 ester cyclase [Quadrisphaera sp. INWT6]
MASTRETNTAAQQHLGELLNAGQIDRIHEVFATDVLDHDKAPDQGDGVEGTKDFFRTLTAAFPDAQLQVDQLVADEDNVVIAYRLSGTHQGDFQGVPATGKRVEARGVQVGRFEDGKIVERWGATDELGILHQLGAQISAPVDSEETVHSIAQGDQPVLTEREDRFSTDDPDVPGDSAGSGQAPLDVRAAESEHEAGAHR